MEMQRASLFTDLVDIWLRCNGTPWGRKTFQIQVKSKHLLDLVGNALERKNREWNKKMTWLQEQMTPSEGGQMITVCRFRQDIKAKDKGNTQILIHYGQTWDCHAGDHRSRETHNGSKLYYPASFGYWPLRDFNGGVSGGCIPGRFKCNMILLFCHFHKIRHCIIVW